MGYKQLNQIATIFNGVRLTRYVDIKNTDKNKEVFKSKISEDTKNFLETEYVALTSEIDEKYYSQKNDIILQTTGLSKIKLITQEVGIIIPMNYIIIRVKKEYNPIFIYHLLKSRMFDYTLKKLSEGTNLQFIRIPDIKQIKLKIPDVETQNKYGNLLKLIDEKNQLEIKKLEMNNKLKTAIIIDKLGDNYVRL